jgi:hypothetical protein
MTQQHPITPPPELRRLWAQQAQRINPNDPVEWMQCVSEKAARWGADQELEAIQKEIITQAWFADPRHRLAQLRAARRPKPPSLKEQALAVLDDTELDSPHYNILLRALKQLDD